RVVGVERRVGQHLGALAAHGGHAQLDLVGVAHRHSPPTNRPGASTRVGSNSFLTRRIRSIAGTGPQVSSAVLSSGGASRTTADPPSRVAVRRSASTVSAARSSGATVT